MPRLVTSAKPHRALVVGLLVLLCNPTTIPNQYQFHQKALNKKMLQNLFGQFLDYHNNIYKKKNDILDVVRRRKWYI